MNTNKTCEKIIHDVRSKLGLLGSYLSISKDYNNTEEEKEIYEIAVESLKELKMLLDELSDKIVCFGEIK